MPSPASSQPVTPTSPASPNVVSGDEQVAQDAAQSAWAIAWRKLDSVRDPVHVRSWLATVAANEARQVLRRRRRETLTAIELDADGRAGNPVGDDLSDEIERADLANALRHLKPEDRALLALRFVAGFDAAEADWSTPPSLARFDGTA